MENRPVMRSLLLTTCLLCCLLLLPAPGWAQSATLQEDASGLGTVRTADFFEILYSECAAEEMTWWKWDAFSDIYVIHFGSYELQGQTLNRIAMFVEKAGFAGRVLSQPELDDYLRRTGQNAATLYGAHDYKTSDLAAFFTQALLLGELSAAEEHLLNNLIKLGLLQQTGNHYSALGNAALLSFASGISPGYPVMLGQADRSWEASALYHETRHGLYFTQPGYVERCQQFWEGRMTGREREMARMILGSLEYNPADEDLMINEWTAWILTPQHAGIGPQALANRLMALRADAYGGLSADSQLLLETDARSFADRIEAQMAAELKDWLGSEWNVPDYDSVASAGNAGRPAG